MKPATLNSDATDCVAVPVPVAASAQAVAPADLVWESNDVAYKLTATTFCKTSKLPFADTRLDGTPFVWARSWNHERITNEVNALRLIAQQTTIPIPRLLDHGTYPDGRQYLVTERVLGKTLSIIRDRPCARPVSEGDHTKDKACVPCAQEAEINALAFVNNVVLPQLSRLQSHRRGIDGFVMPPSWMSPDMEPPWVGMSSWKTRPLPRDTDTDRLYVFQHGDLAAHNIMMDPMSLRVICLIDWEYAGFYPAGMELWPGTLDKRAYRARSAGSARADAIARFLPEDYLERWAEWPDKEQLMKLVVEGEIPHPDACKRPPPALQAAR